MCEIQKKSVPFSDITKKCLKSEKLDLRHLLTKLVLKTEIFGLQRATECLKSTLVQISDTYRPYLLSDSDNVEQLFVNDFANFERLCRIDGVNLSKNCENFVKTLTTKITDKCSECPTT